MSLRIVSNTYTTEEKELKLLAKAWVAKQKAKWQKEKIVKPKPRA